jgi:hypothetical protein
LRVVEVWEMLYDDFRSQLLNRYGDNKVKALESMRSADDIAASVYFRAKTLHLLSTFPLLPRMRFFFSPEGSKLVIPYLLRARAVPRQVQLTEDQYQAYLETGRIP